jgi:hypothetical protein
VHRESSYADATIAVADDIFAAALGAVPAEDWCGTWAASRTIMLRRTSKRVKDAVDKMSLPVVVRLSRSFWNDARKGTAAEKLQLLVMRQLTVATARFRIITLELPHCDMKGQDAESLAGVLAQCPALTHVNLRYTDYDDDRVHHLCHNRISSGGAEILAGVLGQYAALAHLDLSGNNIGAAGAERLAGVLPQCTALAHLDLSRNHIGDAGKKVLKECWRSAQRWLTSISAGIGSDQPGQRGLAFF